jgi:hypothetical protein
MSQIVNFNRSKPSDRPDQYCRFQKKIFGLTPDTGWPMVFVYVKLTGVSENCRQVLFYLKNHDRKPCTFLIK